MKSIRIILALLITLLLAPGADSMDVKKASRDDLKNAFDVVIQNYGALQYSFYTFTLEFERPPENYDEMVKTGHIRVKMKDPYTDKDVTVVDDNAKGKAGNLEYKKRNKQESEFSCFYVDPNDYRKTRSMHSAILIYTHEALHEAVFGDKASREEQLTRVYLLQLDDAIESYLQRRGHVPASLDEMAKGGDVNVNYINPFTGELAKQSEKLSPGDYFYRKFTRKAMHKEPQRQSNGEVVIKEVESEDEFYEVVGWGKTEPIYYFSSDRQKENLNWDNNSKYRNILEILEKGPEK